MTLYTFKDKLGKKGAHLQNYTTQDAKVAEDHARTYGLVCIANQFELVDSVIAWDYTREERFQG